MLLARRNDRAYRMVLLWREEVLIEGNEAAYEHSVQDGFVDAVAQLVHDELQRTEL